MLKQFIAFFWLGGVLLLYGAAGLWVSLVVDAVRTLVGQHAASTPARKPMIGPGGNGVSHRGSNGVSNGVSDRGSNGASSGASDRQNDSGEGKVESRATSSGMGLLVLGVGLALAAETPHLPAEKVWKFWAAGSILLASAVAARFVNFNRGSDWKRIKVWRQDRKQAYLHLLLLTGAALFSAPFFWMVTTALKPEKQVFTNPPTWIPHPIVWSNYPRTFEFLEKALPVGTYDGLLFLWNTLVIAGLSLLGVLLTASMVAYAFARLRWPGRDACFVILLATMMIPDAVTMIPRFMIFRWLGWIDTLRPLWVPAFFGGAYQVFLLRQFFLSIPNELEEAARIDGCSYWTTYWRIMLPQLRPALAALAIMQFMGAWNDFMGPLIYVSSPQLLPGSYALQLFQSAHTGEWTLLMCAATLWTLPVVILFFFTQRQFIEGITLTGIKG